MSLSPAQLVTFKADIVSNPEVAGDLSIGNNNGIRNWYNQDAVPDFIVYRTLVPLDEVHEAIELDDVANITNTNSDRLVKFLSIRPGGVFASKVTDREGFDDIFSAAAGNDSQQALIALWKRLANNIEKLFATGTGSDGDPAIMSYEGIVSLQDVRNALALP